MSYSKIFTDIADLFSGYKFFFVGPKTKKIEVKFEW